MDNNKCHKHNVSCALLTFLAGATIGAVLTALTTKKTGAERCDDLKEMSNQIKLKARSLAIEANKAWRLAKKYAGNACDHEGSECTEDCQSDDFGPDKE